MAAVRDIKSCICSTTPLGNVHVIIRLGKNLIHFQCGTIVRAKRADLSISVFFFLHTQQSLAFIQKGTIKTLHLARSSSAHRSALLVKD